jgi:hypothetical protein
MATTIVDTPESYYWAQGEGMSGKRYAEQFKIAAVKQVAERGHSASEVAARFGVSIHSLYSWTKRYNVRGGVVGVLFARAGERATPQYRGLSGNWPAAIRRYATTAATGRH